MTNKKNLILIWSIAAISSWIIHIFFVALAHSSVLPHFIAFIAWWILQIILWISIWFENFSKHTFWAKNIIHWGFIFMLLFSIFMPVPFLWITESLSNLGIITIVLQLTAILSIIPSFSKKHEVKFSKIFISGFTVAIVSWILAFSLGYAWEEIFPEFVQKAWENSMWDHHGGGHWH